MKLVIDTETNSLIEPTELWCVVCKDIDTGEYHKFREVNRDEKAREALKSLLAQSDLLVGHHLLGYDLPVLQYFLGIEYPVAKSIDTLIISKLADYSRENGHSIDTYGTEFGLEKIYFRDFSHWSQEMENYCVRDVDICARVYDHYLPFVRLHTSAISLEQEFQLIVNSLHDNGFYFDREGAEKLLAKVQGELDVLDKEIEKSFPPRLKLVKEVTPRLTLHGTLNRNDFRWFQGNDLSEFNGGSFCRCSWVPFNAASHKQVVDILTQAGWSPTSRTDTHVETERQINRLKFSRKEDKEVVLKGLCDKLLGLKKYGWKVNEENLSTLPPDAPAPARTLAKRILLESRRRTLTEWRDLASAKDGRIHGEFQGIGAWTHRMSHQKPNTANIPNAVRISDGSTTLLGKELRSLWRAPRKRLLVGVDAEAIQLRVFAHLINDPELTYAILNGKKADKTDPHSLNQRYFGSYCKTRNAAKHSLYAIFFGGGAGKIAHIMACTKEQAMEAIENLKEKYPGLTRLEREVFPVDAKRGYFIGIDGRHVKLPGETVGDRKHLCMSGYLQCGEAIVIKRAACHFEPQLKQYDSFLVDIIHDEYQLEVPNNMEIALKIAELVSTSINWAGEFYQLNCPMAGSYWNEDKKDYTIGTNWYVTH